MSSLLTRRAFCGRLGGTALAMLPVKNGHAAPEPRSGLTLGFGNYGMPSAKVEEAVRLIAGLGFDSLELSLMPDWDSTPATLSVERHRTLRRMLADNGLALTSLMEDIPPSSVDAEHQTSLDRLKRAAELGRDLSPDRVPLIQTVLGGGKWDDKKGLYRDRVGDWLQVAESNKTCIAVKPHRSGAMSQPLEAAWLFEQLGSSSWMGMVYDYSHYALRNLSIAETVKVALPLTVHIAVKNITLKGDRPEFVLPGEAGTIDYGEILTRFYESGYRRDVCCEVSSQVFRRPGYDAAAAAKACTLICRRSSRWRRNFPAVADHVLRSPPAVSHSPRRRFLKQLGALPAAALLAPCAASTGAAPEIKSPNERWRIGVIGMRYQGSVITREALAFGDVHAICDVDRHVREQARASFNSSAAISEDYRDMIARDDIDVVLIGAPDHWHARMTIDACRAGKDVYVEKPLTLTVDEGRVLRRVVEETGRVVQVGTWQRHDHRFRLAAEMIRAGRLGTIRKVTVVLGKNQSGGPFPVLPIPKNLNWDRWLGQAPATEYIPERCHYNFRYWFDYAGGEMTDTGAHHLDIALWALGLDDTGPVEIAAEGTLPNVPAGYTVPKNFRARLTFVGGVEFEVLDQGRDGILFEGEQGRIFVNRGTLSGTPVDELKSSPLPREAFRLYAHDNLARPERAGKIEAISNHIGNFYDCTQSRKTPISSVPSQHRVATACHLANLAIRLGRKLCWNPNAEQFVNDAEAGTHLRRDQRPGYEVT